jgi:hypothetical protein
LRSLTSVSFYHCPFTSLFLSFFSIFSFSAHTCITLFVSLSCRFVCFYHFLAFLRSSFPTVQSEYCSKCRNAWLLDIVLCLQKKIVVFWWQDSKFLAASSKYKHDSAQ